MRTPTIRRPDARSKADTRSPRRAPSLRRRRQLQLVFEAVVADYIQDITSPRAHAGTLAGVRA